MDFQEEVFAGHLDTIHLEEYETIRDKINLKYQTNATALQIRSEFEDAYNKLFEKLLVDHSHEVFNIIYVLMDCFNIDEIKAVRYLKPENKEIVKAFAKSKCETFYYEKIEQGIEKEKCEKKGITFFEHSNIKDLFE
jgi:hypothetical protein